MKNLTVFRRWVWVVLGITLLVGVAYGQDSLNVTKVGEIAYWDDANGVAVSGSYAYAADYSAGLRVINVSNPSAPIEVGYYDTPGSASGVAVSGSYAYVADYIAGLRVINVSNPAAPIEVGYYDTPGVAHDVAVSGSYAYVVDYSAGPRVINVSNPAAPTELGYYNTPGWAFGVAVSGSYAYMADYRYFGIYQFTPPSITISISPRNPPITIPASGGSFSYNVSVTNNSASPQTTDAWIMTQLPGGSWYGPMLGPINLTLPANTSITRLRTQSIPAVAPAGVYWYEGRGGGYPSTIIDTSGFSFTKLGSREWGLGAGEWTNTGEEFEVGRTAGNYRIASALSGSGATPTMVIFPNPFNPTTVVSFELRQLAGVRYCRTFSSNTGGRLAGSGCT